MNIAYIGRITLSTLAARFDFDRPLPNVEFGFHLGVEMVSRLIARGHNISVIVAGSSVAEIQVYHADKCNVYIIPEGKRVRWQYLTLFAKEVCGIRDCLRQIKPDVVFAQWTYHNAYAGLTSGFPTLVVAHDSPWRVYRVQPNSMTLIRALYAQFLVLPRVKHITAVSPHIVRELKRFKCLRTLDISVVPNGIEVPSGANTQPRSNNIVCVSEWGPLKNAKTLLLAFVDIRRRHPDWRLIMMGCWLDKDRGAGEWMKANNLPVDGIDFRGLQPYDEVSRVFKEAAGLFVSPSLEESFGMVFVEAMRFGVPCVGGEKSGAVPWVIGDGGIVCDVTKPKKLADCIEKVMADNELRIRLGEMGRKRVREAFDIEKVIDMYEAELKKVAGC